MQHRIGILMNGVTGRMGTNQHLMRSIVAIRAQGGVPVPGTQDTILPDPILIGRNADKLAALAGRVREATAGWSPERFAAAELIFTAHAIPEPVARTSRYTQQFAETAQLVAAALGHLRHTVAYQSGPGDSRIAWTGPDIVPVVQAAHAAGARDLVVQAAGFLVDHTEVLYDLDVEARGEAARLGVGFTRAACVHDHPAFIAMLADGVEAAFAMQGAGVG